MPDYLDSMFSVRQMPWHKKGLITDRPPNDIQEAREWAGLTWEPEYAPVYNEMGLEIPGWKQIRRDDDQSVLSIEEDSYEIITNREMFEIMGCVMKQGAFLDTAGSAKKGRLVWALAHLNEPISLPGDSSPVMPYVVMLTSHDKSAAGKVFPTMVRVVCANTWQMANEKSDSGMSFSFRHTKNVKERMEEAKKILGQVQGFAELWKKNNEELLSIQISDAGVKKFITEFFPTPKVQQTDRQVDNLISARNTLEWLINSAQTTEGIRGTAYCLVQAAGEFADHYRGHRGADAFIQRTLLSKDPLKIRAYKLIKEVSKV